MKTTGLSREEKNAIVYKKTPARIAAEEASIKLNAVTEVTEEVIEVVPEVAKKSRAKKVVTEEIPVEVVEAVAEVKDVAEEIINPEN